MNDYWDGDDGLTSCHRCGEEDADRRTGLCFMCKSQLEADGEGNWSAAWSREQERRSNDPVRRAKALYQGYQDWRALLYAELERMPEDYRRALIGDLRQTLERLAASNMALGIIGEQ